jgi:hypothetical protein
MTDLTFGLQRALRMVPNLFNKWKIVPDGAPYKVNIQIFKNADSKSRAQASTVWYFQLSSILMLVNFKYLWIKTLTLLLSSVFLQYLAPNS